MLSFRRSFLILAPLQISQVLCFSLIWETQIKALCCHAVDNICVVPRLSGFAFIRRSFIACAVILDEFLCLQAATKCENVFS